MVNFILGVIAAVVIGIVRELAKRVLWGPRLKVEFRATQEFIVDTIEWIQVATIQTTPEEFLRGDPGRPGPSTTRKCSARYVRLKVLNEGIDIAKNCSGYLINVELWNGEEFVTTGFHDTIPLCWSYLDNGASQRLDILKGIPQYLDIFSTREGSRTVSPRIVTVPMVLECSPKADPGVMRVPAAWTAGRILDERQASQPRADHQEAA